MTTKHASLHNPSRFRSIPLAVDQMRSIYYREIVPSSRACFSYGHQRRTVSFLARFFPARNMIFPGSTWDAPFSRIQN